MSAITTVGDAKWGISILAGEIEAYFRFHPEGEGVRLQVTVIQVHVRGD